MIHTTESFRCFFASPAMYSGTEGAGYLLVILILFVKNSIAPSPVMSMSPYLDFVP